MVRIEQIAQAALAGESLETRSLTQDFLQENPDLKLVPRPDLDDLRTLAASASLLELFAERRGQKPPAWTNQIGSLPEPIFLVKAAMSMKYLRALCEAESPEPLRKRGFYAPPEYLVFA